MNIYFAHNGVDHATESEAIAHSAKTNWPIIVAVTAVCVLLMLAVTYYVTRKMPKKTHKKETINE